MLNLPLKLALIARKRIKELNASGKTDILFAGKIRRGERTNHQHCKICNFGDEKKLKKRLQVI